jgi:AraC-like DNA-binding protein
MTGSKRNLCRLTGVGSEPLGLFRQVLTGSAPAETVRNLFSDLRRVNLGEFLGEDPRRHLQGSRILIDRAQGHGTWELYRLDQDLYVVAADGTYDSPRFEVVPGEGLVEFHLRLAGTLELTLPGRFEPLVAAGPCLLVMHQPPGVDVSERVVPRRRDTGVSLYCRPEYLAELVQRNSIASWPMLEEIQAHQQADTVWHRLLPLSPGLLYVGKSLLQSPFHRGTRLLHAEAKALEILCEVLSMADAGCVHAANITDGEVRQLERARQMLSTQLSSPPRIAQVARAIGMSESKLKRCFKERYGHTVFDFGLEHRMRHALHLLRSQRMSVDQVAHAVGYRHQTSFSAAFRHHFGFLPRNARNDVH